MKWHLNFQIGTVIKLKKKGLRHFCAVEAIWRWSRNMNTNVTLSSFLLLLSGTSHSWIAQRGGLNWIELIEPIGFNCTGNKFSFAQHFRRWTLKSVTTIPLISSIDTDVYWVASYEEGTALHPKWTLWIIILLSKHVFSMFNSRDYCMGARTIAQTNQFRPPFDRISFLKG